jgi:predicted nuclease of predicted toxin-antitoxin system
VTVRLLANENLPGPLVRALRREGHDVVWVREAAPGVADPEVLRRAQASQRIVVTQDKDFGTLAFQSRAGAPPGIVLVRVRGGLDRRVARVVAALRSDRKWTGHFATIEASRIRLRALPLE